MLLQGLLAAPRQSGSCSVELTALDAAARGLFVTQYIEYNGLLSVGALQSGLHGALSAYPVLTGWLAQERDGNMRLCWDTHNSDYNTFKFSASVCKAAKVPSIWSTWQLWRQAALPDVHNRLAAAKVTLYPNANKSILVFSFDHAVFDQITAHKFLHLWLQQSAAAAAADAGAPAAVAAAAAKSMKTPATASLVKPLVTVIADGCSNQHAADPGYEPASLAQDVPPGAAAAAAAAAGVGGSQLAMFGRSCFFTGWNLPESKEESLEWLQQHQGASCPFPWNPLDPADSCLMGWKGLLQGSDSEFSTWVMPGQLLQRWKSAAEAACPLPKGVWYSSGTAAAAVMLVTLYAAAPQKAKQLGGLHLSTVVNLRGGRCGLDIPQDSATNASVSAIRVWCPETMLSAAAAALNASVDSGSDGGNGSSSGGSNCSVVCPELMRHLRMGLHEQLTDPHGTMNKQFEWFEATRRAGLTSQVQLCQGLLQTDAGDVVMDMITHSAAELPTLPGTTFAAGSVRMLSSYMDRIVMVTPVPRADGQPGSDLQIEVSFPKSRTSDLYKTWRQLGFQQVFRSPATKEGLMYPNSVYLCVWMVIGCLPWLLLRWLRQLCGFFRRAFCT